MATYDIDNVDVSALVAEDTITCAYSGTIKSIELPVGTFKFECWGADGGYAYNNSTHRGGYGGYSVGEITLSTPLTLYLVVGGHGTNGTTGSGIKSGGYNGGGNSGYQYAGAGGGATHVATITGLLSTLSSDSSAVGIVAGGGGGGTYRSNSYSYYGGNGGGTTGADGVGYSTNYAAKGGTQTEGGKYGGYTTGYYGESGSFGKGGNATTTSSSYNRGAGGGGGYYGGGGGGYRNSSSYYYGISGGGGGSGYVASDFENSGTYSTSDSEFVTNPDTTKNGYILITVINISVPTGDVYDFEYTGAVQTMTLSPGQYKLECWGAQGGYQNDATLGHGGYSVGKIIIKHNTTLYLYVGGAGVTGNTGGGFNGGGSTVVANNDGSPGGGGTDIRIGSTSLYARVIVAGGGGGLGFNSTPGVGGGLVGGDGNTTGKTGLGGTQTAGGASAGTKSTAGSFGQGGNGQQDTYAAAGGGGGWYGGSSGYASASDGGYSGGGGSGYVYTSSTASNYPSGCLLNSSYYLTDASTVGGLQSIPEPDGTTATGHTGNGYIRITFLGTVETGFNGRVNIGGTWNNISNMYVKVNNVWNGVTGAYIKKDGEWLSIGGGSGPSPGPTPSTRTLITQESVTTVTDSTFGGALGNLSYASQITADPLIVTIGNDEYVLNKRQLVIENYTYYYYGADLYIDSNSNIKADFTSNYWFTIFTDESTNILLTSSADTYSIKLESDSALHVLRLLPSNYEYVGTTPTSPENMYANVDSDTSGSCAAFGSGSFTLNGFSLSTLPTGANVVNFDVRIKLVINTGTPQVKYGLANMESTSENITLSGNINRVYTFSNNGFYWDDIEAAWNEYYEDSKFLGIRFSITSGAYMAAVYGAELDVIYEL